MSTELTKAEYETLNQALAQEGAKHGFQKLLSQYRSFIGQVEGYGFSIYDYDNDLAIRDWLEGALAQCDQNLRAKAEALVAPLDEAFCAATEEHSRPSYPESEPGARWHRRLPKNPGEELAKDIREGNL